MSFKYSYFQWALMLTDAGKKLKPIWLSKIINAQNQMAVGLIITQC